MEETAEGELTEQTSQQRDYRVPAEEFDPQQRVYQADQDVYLDLLQSMQDLQPMETQQEDESERPSLNEMLNQRRQRPENRLKVTFDEEGGPQVNVKPPGLLDAEGRITPAVERRPDKGVVIHSLAGSSTDVFNTQMARSENLLKQGKYYAAADAYETAVRLNPSNPLARVGMALSLFGAGEPSTAGHHLAQAMKLFPPLIETRLDLQALTGEKRFVSRLKVADERLAGETEKDPRVALITMYLHHSRGEQKAAQAAARKLLAVASNDVSNRGVYTMAARYILTGESPRDEAKPEE